LLLHRTIKAAGSASDRDTSILPIEGSAAIYAALQSGRVVAMP